MPIGILGGGGGAISIDSQVIVKQASDLSGILDSTKIYFIDGIIDMGTQSIEVPATGLNLIGGTFDVSQLVSSADNYTMFTSPVGGSGNLLGQDIGLTTSGTGSKVYDLTDATGFNAFEFQRVNYNNCTSLGDIYNYRQGLEDGTGRFGASPSLTLHGTWVGGFRITTSIVRGMSDTTTEPLFKAGTAFVMNSRFLTDINCDLGTLQPFADFTPAMFPNPSTIQVQNGIFTRDSALNNNDANIFPNLTYADLACDWKGNLGLNNTYVGGKLNNSVQLETVINTTGTAEDLNGTFTGIDLQHFDSPANGRLRHLGIKPHEFSVSWDFVIEGKNNDNYELFLIKIDTLANVTVELAQVRTVNNLQGGRDVGIWSGVTSVTLNQGDLLLWQVANLLDTDNCTLELDSAWVVQER